MIGFPITIVLSIIVVAIFALWARNKLKSIGKRLGWFIIFAFIIPFSIAQDEEIPPDISIDDPGIVPGGDQPLTFPDALPPATQSLAELMQAATDQETWEKGVKAFLNNGASTINMYNLSLFNQSNITLTNYNNSSVLIA